MVDMTQQLTRQKSTGVGKHCIVALFIASHDWAVRTIHSTACQHHPKQLVPHLLHAPPSSAGLRGRHLGFIHLHGRPHGVFSRGHLRMLQGVAVRTEHAVPALIICRQLCNSAIV